MRTNLDDRTFWLDFIRLYEENPCLWKVKSKDYNNRFKKTRAYDILINKLKEKYENPNRETVVKKINILRSSFRKELRKVKESVSSGAVGDDIYHPNLWFYDHLLFVTEQETDSTESCNDRDNVSNYDLIGNNKIFTSKL